MSEIKPVAYLHVTDKNKKERYLEFSLSDNENFTSVPLYTKEQLQPRVKMTQKQYTEWESVINSIYPINLYELFNLIFNPAEHHGEYAGMRDIFSFDKGQKTLAKLWTDFDPEHPEETIDIVTEKKWFVRSIKISKDGEYAWLSDEAFELDAYVPNYLFGKTPPESSRIFDSKEQAEEWNNPLTEAFLLPIDD